jgi:hypothetical protein
MTFSIVRETPHIDDPYPPVFQFRVLNSERLPSLMREALVPIGMVLVGAWDRWFRKQAPRTPSCSDIRMMDMQDAPTTERLQANQVYHIMSEMKCTEYMAR